jgi:hypothetical protein
LIIWSWFTGKKRPSNFWRKKYVAKWYTINKLTWKTQTHTLCDKLCQWLATGWWFSPGIPVSSTNKTDRHDKTEILLKVALNTITLSRKQIISFQLENFFHVNLFIVYHFATYFFLQKLDGRFLPVNQLQIIKFLFLALG